MQYNIGIEVGALEPTITFSVYRYVYGAQGLAFAGLGNNRDTFENRLSIADCEKLINDLQIQMERAKKVKNALG